MKKIVVFLFSLALTFNSVQARDYAKLQAKEMKHAQKYGTTQQYLPKSTSVASFLPTTTVTNIKDPKIMKFGNYNKVDGKKYNAKVKSDDIEYAKIEKSLCKRTVDNYNAKAKGEDYYRIYRIAERIIRANNLDYINWRIGIERESEAVNAYSTQTNYICITTALYDTFNNNEDALALVIGHEMGHALLGHQKRLYRLRKKMQTIYDPNNGLSALAYAGIARKYYIESKNAEYAADVEGAKLIAKAGYNLDSANEVMRYFETLPRDRVDWYSDHPDPEKRIENLEQNSRFFINDEWQEMGKANIYNSSVLNVQLSSDRKSITINGNPNRIGRNEFYQPETPADVYTRCGYKAYVNGQFGKSVEYFNELFKLDKSNASAYLYASYASEALYKNTGKTKYLEDAKTYARGAQILDPKNKYVIEQIDSL